MKMKQTVMFNKNEQKKSFVLYDFVYGVYVTCTEVHSIWKMSENVSSKLSWILSYLYYTY